MNSLLDVQSTYAHLVLRVLVRNRFIPGAEIAGFGIA